jgi:hypothetical protein
MNLTNKTQTDKDIEMLEDSASQSLRIVIGAAQTLNRSYRSAWSLPDERLQPLLQQLLVTDKLTEVFTKHQTAATALNVILDSEGYAGERAIAVAGREFTVDADGVLTLAPIPELEPIFVEEPIVEEPIVEEV